MGKGLFGGGKKQAPAAASGPSGPILRNLGPDGATAPRTRSRFWDSIDAAKRRRAAGEEEDGPVVTQLGDAQERTNPLRRNKRGRRGSETILTAPTLGG